MSKKIVFDLDVDPSGANTGVKSLKAQLKEATTQAQLLAEQFGATSNQAVAAAKKAAGLKEEIADIKQTIDALHPEAKFNAIINVTQGIAGGFAAAEGAMALFGQGGQDLQKVMLKIQAATALSQGLNQINGLKDGFQNLGIVVKQSAVYTKLAGVAQATYSAIVGVSTGALKIFKLALVATGIGAVIVGLGTLVAYWSDLTKFVEKNSESVKKWGLIIAQVLFPPLFLFMQLKNGVDALAERFDFVKVIVAKVGDQFGILKDKIVSLLEYVGILSTSEEKAAEARLEQSKTRERAIQKEIDIARAQGKSAVELAALEVELSREKLLAYDQYIKARIKSGREITETEKQQLEDFAFDLKKSKEELLKAIKDANKKQEEEDKKKHDEQLKKQKEQHDKMLALQNELNQAIIDGMADGSQKEIAQINSSFDLKMSALKGNSDTEIALRAQLEENKSQQIEAIQKKYADINAAAAHEAIQNIFTDKIEQLQIQSQALQDLGQQDFEVQRRIAVAQKNKELDALNLSDQQKINIISKYNNTVAKINLDQYKKEIQQAQAVAQAKVAFAQSTVNSLSMIATALTNNSKKQIAINKATAIAQLAIDEAKAISAVVAGMSAAASATGPAAEFTLPLFLAEGALAIATPLVAAKKALNQGGGSVDIGSGNIGGASGGGVVPQTFSQGQQANVVFDKTKRSEAAGSNYKTYVLETDISRTQGRISSIEEKAAF